ncbi:DNA-directed RNA polymerase III subunit RPC4 [Planococcus citri]|uniref:DNA-directed RNA polymerase III subunit RPC4 n=1 Tax=Planococcus citri TaxID=170843 RepID=UPI0031FA4251
MNPSGSQRLPSFRDFSEMQKAIPPFTKSKLLSKKTYVPNLGVSRKTPSTQIKEEAGAENSTNKRDTPQQRRERKHNVVQTEGIFSSGIDKASPSSSGKFGGKSGAASGSGSIKNKQLKKVVEKLDGQRKSNPEMVPLKDVFWERRPEEFEKHPVSVQDLPSALPWTRIKKGEPIKSESDTIKDSPLLKDILKPNDEVAPLFVLKTPKYIPAVLDNSQNPKIKVKTNDSDTDGYKCTIHDLPEGQIGKLHIMKSGKLRLVLGECKFTLQQGVKVNFKEELAVVNVDPSKKMNEIVNLGDVNNRIIMVPENITDLITAT